MLDQLGGEFGCLRLATEFYSRVAENTDLKPLFPGKSLRCATEEFSAFLVQFLDGDESKTQYRWWLSLKESHGRFQISEEQRSAWLGLMRETIHDLYEDPETRQTLQRFFLTSSAYIVGKSQAEIGHTELSHRWETPKSLDRLVEYIAKGYDFDAIELTKKFKSRPAVFVGILEKMMATGRELPVEFVLASITANPDLVDHPYNGRGLLHFAAGCSCLPVVQLLITIGADPNTSDSGGHAPLYRVASTNGSIDGSTIIRELVRAGAAMNHNGGVMRATALHQAARFGDLEVAKALVDAGANPMARDKKGLTPLDRAVSGRRHKVAAFLASL